MRKAPTLTPGQPPHTALWQLDQVTACPPEPDVIGRLAVRTLHVACARGLWLYARIDVSRDRSGRPHVAQVEGTEPSLFFPDPTRPGVSPNPEN
jgi:hypothetical protein